MPVPKRKLSRSRRDSRSANKGIKPQTVGSCSNCQSPNLSHQVCQMCGFYKGRKVLVSKAERHVVRQSARAKGAEEKQASPEAQSE